MPCTRSPTASVSAVFPVLPIYFVGFEVATDSSAQRREEEALAKPCKQPESFELVLDRTLHFCKAQFNAGNLLGIVQFGQHIG